MSELYMWHTTNTPITEAKSSFDKILAEQANLYQSTFNKQFQYRSICVDETIIGVVYYDLGVKSWDSWLSCGDCGIAWSGVCETLLEKPISDLELRQFVKDLNDGTSDVLNWDGRFCFCAWNVNEKQVHFVSSLTSQSMWIVKGSKGWALGCRGYPIIRMLEKPVSINIPVARMCLSNAYIVGDEHLFNHVERLWPGTHLQFSPGRSKEKVLGSFVNYLGSKATTYEESSNLNTALTEAATSLEKRIELQIKYSKRPIIAVTAGRDSRLIAAVASTVDPQKRVSTFTGGPVNNIDVIIGTQVAKKLGFDHAGQNEKHEMRHPFDDIVTIERLKRWTRITEGMETIRHARPYYDYLRNGYFSVDDTAQYFHGLGGELARGTANYRAYAPHPFSSTENELTSHNLIRARACLIKRMLGFVNKIELVEKPLFQFIDKVDQLSKDTESVVFQYMQFAQRMRHYQWGEDMMSVKMLIQWRWTPLLDRGYVSALWSSDPNKKWNNEIVETLIDKFAPVLVGLNFEKPNMSRLPSRRAAYDYYISQSLRKRFSEIKYFLSGPIANRYASSYWQNFFFNQKRLFWRQLITEKALENIILRNSTSGYLWSLATVDLFARSFDGE